MLQEICWRCMAICWRHAAKKLALWSNMLALAGLGGSMLSLCRVILGLQIIRDVWSKCWPLIINVGPEHEDASHLHQYVQNENMGL